MLVAAGLFVRTLSNLHSIELGFNRENVLLFQLDARKAGHKDPEIAAFYADLRKAVQRDPWRAQRESLGGFAHRSREWTADRRIRRATQSGQPYFDGRTGVLHNHADSDSGRP